MKTVHKPNLRPMPNPELFPPYQKGEDLMLPTTFRYLCAKRGYRVA